MPCLVGIGDATDHGVVLEDVPGLGRRWIQPKLHGSAVVSAADGDDAESVESFFVRPRAPGNLAELVDDAEQVPPCSQAVRRGRQQLVGCGAPRDSEDEDLGRC
jgi:hypothetical protein